MIVRVVRSEEPDWAWIRAAVAKDAVFGLYGGCTGRLHAIAETDLRWLNRFKKRYPADPDICRKRWTEFEWAAVAPLLEEFDG